MKTFLREFFLSVKKTLGENNLLSQVLRPPNNNQFYLVDNRPSDFFIIVYGFESISEATEFQRKVGVFSDSDVTIETGEEVDEMVSNSFWGTPNDAKHKNMDWYSKEDYLTWIQIQD